ncbi:protein furry homolog-like, partial [Lingula anatina]|uniref:Protein furry homolog-like n=1 Tax=Lingula anatina TaxID=7574 RepID=A0A2R2MK16_LINAN
MAESREEPLGLPQNGQIQPADDSTEEHTKQPSQITLPWGGSKDRMAFPPAFNIDTDIRPGEFVMRTLFAEFFVLAEQKIELVLTEPLERPLSKSLQRKEDTEFDQLLSTLGNVAEHCLPSLLRTLYKWFDRQCPPDGSLQHELKQKMKSKTAADRTEREYLLERRELAVDFLYCLVLIEVLKQLPFHPGQDDLITHLLLQAFRHFKYKDIPASSPNGTNVSTISDLYAEVIGVLAQSRFQAVRKKFMLELKELRSKDQSLAVTQSAIISLLMGLKFFRVKMHPIEEFEACVHFLQELGNYFLEVREKDIKHALAGLFVEILLPVASVVKHEVNVPVLKNFVESLFTTTTEMSTRKKHQLALYPMLTCLLCVSQKSFFLANWSPFLTMCLTQLRNRDPKMSRVALESLYRLLWVYMIRIKCESNTTTLSKLQSISSSLFPKGGRSLIPKDTPLNIFVKIIQFVAQERLDFAMREIVFDLLCVGKPIRVVNPQRMSVGLRAFLVVADSLQQKDGEPPMPQTVGVMPSGNTLRVKKTFLNKMLTDGVAKTIGMSSYYPQIRKAFDGILRVLDREVGRNLAMTKPENVNKDLEELMIGERKAKIDLFRTCVAAIPRLFPEGMQKSEVVDLLTRLMIHVDEKLRELSLQALQNLVLDFPSWREDVLHGFIQFVQKEIGDSFPGQQHLDNFLRVLLQFLTQWKTAAQAPFGAKLSAHKLPFDRSSHANVMNEIEGFALVMLCNCKPLTRKLAACILKEVRTLFSILGTSKVDDPCVIDVIDKAMPNIIEKLLPYLPSQEKNAIQSASNIDLQWLCERTSAVWVAGYHEHNITLDTSRSGAVTNEFDPWVVCLANFLGQDCLYTSCPHAIAHAWPIVYYRLQSYMDPNVNPSIVSDTRSSSILRSGSKKMASEKDLYNNLWRNYVVFACCIAPSGPGATPRCSSPELSSSPESSSSERSEPRPAGVITVCASNLFKQLTPLIRSDALDTRETIVNGLGRCNPDSFRALVEELVPYIKEAIDRKQEKVARRKKRDALRVLLVRIFKLLAENKTFAHSNTKVVDAERHTLSPTFVEYIDGARIFLDNEGDREQPMLQEIRVYFAGFVTQLIIHTPVEYRYCLLSRDLRYSLFFLFAGWSGRFGTMFGAVDRRQGKDEACTDFELAAVHAMSAVVCCGQVFDPSGLNEDGYLYSWLDVLLGTHDEK